MKIKVPSTLKVIEVEEATRTVKERDDVKRLLVRMYTKGEKYTAEQLLVFSRHTIEMNDFSHYSAVALFFWDELDDVGVLAAMCGIDYGDWEALENKEEKELVLVFYRGLFCDKEKEENLEDHPNSE